MLEAKGERIMDEERTCEVCHSEEGRYDTLPNGDDGYICDYCAEPAERDTRDADFFAAIGFH
jgi:hypothetical protein